MPRVVHFEISSDNPERTEKFYSEIFGWSFSKWNGPQDYWLVTTGEAPQPGINGGMFRRGGPINYVNTIDVPDIDAFIGQVTARGGEVVVPKMEIPNVGWLVYCKDTEGNVFGMMQAFPGH